MMGMMRCDQVMDQLWEFLDGELPPEEEAALQRHLDVCAACFPQYDFRRAFLAYLRTLAHRDRAPVEVRRHVFDRLLELEKSGRVER